MKKRSTVNIIHDIENADAVLRSVKDKTDRKRGGFLPIRSATCPHARLPIKTPAICTDVIVDVIHALSHTILH